MAQRNIKCALFSAMRWDWAASAALTCPGLDFVTFGPATLGIAHASDPFGLPEDTRADVAVFGSTFYEWLRARQPDRIDDVLRTLARRAEVVVGLDSGDAFELTFPPRILEQMSAVIKGQGLFRDRDLYNYVVGPIKNGAIWAEKQRPRTEVYRDADLERLRLSVPCFAVHLPGIQREARRREGTAANTMGRRMRTPERLARNVAEPALFGALSSYGMRRRRQDAHCVVRVSHVQRVEVMRLLDGLSGTRGITGFPSFIVGTEFGWDLPAREREDIIRSARPYLIDHIPRSRYLLDMYGHRAIVAPTGWGELTFRHIEALRSGGVLVCQDLSHVEMMMPLRDRENAVFCRPDLSDLRSTILELARDDTLCERIGRQGLRSFKAWSRTWRELVRTGIEDHVREAVGVS